MDKNKKLFFFISFILIVITAFLGYILLQYDLYNNLIKIIDKTTPVPIFIVLFLTLPILGFPVSIFLVLSGIKFGTITGLLLIVILIPLHLTITFVMVKRFKDTIGKYLLKKGYQIPEFKRNKQIRYTFLIFILPPIPYAIKNMLLPMTGIPFHIFLTMGCLCHGILSAPIVLLGGSATDLNSTQFIIAIACILIVFLGISMIEKKYSKIILPQQNS